MVILDMPDTNSYSVIMPVYNKARHLHRSINSVLTQLHPATELIVVNDASTDESLHVLRSIHDSRLKIINNRGPNLGPGGARNLGIQHAQCPWIAFLDADDEWKPNFLRTIHERVLDIDSNTVCLFTGFENDYGDVRSLHEYTSLLASSASALRLNAQGYIRAWLETKRSPIHTSSVVIRRDTLVEVGMFPTGANARRGEDIALWLKCILRGDAIAIPQVCAVYYRDADNMVTKSASAQGLPVICRIIADALPTRTSSEQALLKRLNNHIIYDYARIASRTGRISGALISELYIEKDFLNTLKLLALMLMPHKMRSWLRRTGR